LLSLAVVLVSAFSFLISTQALTAGTPAPRPLRAPLISQRFPKGRPPGYRGESRCGPASMAMIARAFHREPKLSDAMLIEELDRLDDGLENQATAPAGILRMAAALRLRASLHPGFDGAWLRRVLRRGGLVIALGRPRFLPQTEAHTAGHFVDIVGITRHGNFIVNDSYRRESKSGRRYRVSEETLASFIRHKPNGTLFAIGPTPPRSRARANRSRARPPREP
jgi:hypothetical protein